MNLNFFVGSGVLTMVCFALYLNMLTDFIRILDCYIAIVFPYTYKLYITQKNSFALGVSCWFVVLGLSAIFYFTELTRFDDLVFSILFYILY